MRLIVLDRDGVINQDSAAFVKSPEEWQPLPGALAAIAALSAAGYRVVIFTNQSGIARGLFGPRELEAIHAKLVRAVENAGGRIDGIYSCPHGPDDTCECRKPAPGLLLRIRRELDTPLAGVPVVGDSLRDLQAALAVGARAILVRTGNGEATLAAGIPPSVEVFDDLAAVAAALLTEEAPMAGTASTRDKPVTVGLVLRSIAQNLVFVVSLLIWALLSQLTFPFPYRYRYWFITRWTHFNLWWLELVCNLRCEVRGLENIPREGGGIVLAKHQSTWETMALQRWFNPQTWVLKRELKRMPVFGWAIALLDPVAIDRSARSDAVRRMCEEGAERLRDGRWVVIFPEGTRMPPGQKGRYRIGGGVLAERTGATVIPVAHNAGEFWGRNQLLKRPGVIQVRIGPPIDTHGKSAHEIVLAAEAWIEAQMAELGKRGQV